MAISRFALVFIGLGILPGLSLAAPTLQDATNTFKKGNHAMALDQVNGYLAGKPKDPQGRFLKGLILTELNRTNEAIETFNDLTDEFPELPEPYNNLAVLYANQGQFERAKNSLEMAIRTHPAYATAHENLGDIYAKMASMAYNKALQLDKSNASAQTKLALVKEMFSPPSAAKPKVAAVSAPVAAAKPATMKPATSASPAQPGTAIETPAAAPAEKPKVAVAEKPADKAAEKPAEKPKAAAAEKPADKVAEKPTEKPSDKVAEKPAEKPKAGGDKANAQGDIEQQVNAWAAAWSKQDVDAYLSYYVADYAPPGSAHADWVELRKARLSKPTFIRVGVADMKIKMLGAKKAIVQFNQAYESSILKNTTTKTLVFEQIDGTWKITEEIS
jgi:tetratricopeptide (TPR) repeat protein